jgi:hypothetical protein
VGTHGGEDEGDAVVGADGGADFLVVAELPEDLDARFLQVGSVPAGAARTGVGGSMGMAERV